MSKLDDVKGELPKIERTYQLDPETAITVREDGTWFEGTKKTQKGDRAHVVRLARSKIILDGMLNPIDSDEDRGLRILIDGRAYSMTREGLATGPEVLKWLTSRGALINPAESTNMLRYIHESELRDIDAYTMNGWQRNGAFVVGDRVLRGEGFVLTTQATRTEYSARGSFEEWQQEVLERAKAKPGWLFLILIGLSSPLLARLGIETGTAFNCFAKSSTGKTAGLKAAAGVWGRPDAQGCLKSFNMTLAAVEGVAQGGNGVGLFLDELRTASKSVLKEFAYAFGNGVGRERMKSNAEMRKVRHWLCNAAMSSEKTVEGIFAEMDEAQAGGMILRLIDQDMNPFLPHIGAEDVRAFEDVVARCYGVAGPEFVRRLMDIDDGDLRARHRAALLDLYAGGDSRLERAAASYAQLIVAGEIMGIDATVVSDAWRAWLDGVVEANVMDDHVGIARRIVDLIDAEMNAGIIRIGSAQDDDYGNSDEVDDEVTERGYSSRTRLGWYDDEHVYLTADTLAKVLRGFDRTAFCQWAHDNGALLKAQSNRWVAYIPKLAPRRQAFWFNEDALRSVTH